ncbi:NTP transferase domain-containing protein [Patescibacteria group bacterium]|nr:NTP transferase domain-containing protein [Patescibacteria group bacterium]MBU1703066.1 NTP transferase domain-containing protein [Patescibacteria group bacterium]MBU1954159.1 NTP transferase domain-containing protein [Patescibacteria group bacterium]
MDKSAGKAAVKGIVLAGGNGRRLEPLTSVTNKHLLAVYDKPMIYYPLGTLLNAGVKDILIITGRDHAGRFLKLLGSGGDLGCRFSFAVQDEAGGIAQALALAENFVGKDNCAVILGDNIFEDDFGGVIGDFRDRKGARIFIKDVPDPHRFGVAELNGEKVINIEEKPSNPKSSYAVTGLYLYDNDVFSVIKDIEPSGRGEMEITDVNNHYIQKGLMRAHFVKREWTDAGTFESLYNANRIARNIELAKS